MKFLIFFTTRLYFYTELLLEFVRDENEKKILYYIHALEFFKHTQALYYENFK